MPSAPRKPRTSQRTRTSLAKLAPRSGPPVAADRKEELVRAIEAEILDGSLAPGERLDERALAERFNISRTPVREALNRLATTGLIEVRRNAGMFVATFTLTEVLELYEAVAEIEMIATRLSTRRATAIQRQRILELAAEFRSLADTGDIDAFAAKNIVFHEVIYEASHNRYLAQLARQARRRVWAFRKMHFGMPGRMQISAHEHLALAAAINEGNEDEVVRILHAHGNVRSEAFNDFRMILSFSLGDAAHSVRV
jgi:DNA-binding GntR family transcriptional regulator